MDQIQEENEETFLDDLFDELDAAPLVKREDLMDRVANFKDQCSEDILSPIPEVGHEEMELNEKIYMSKIVNTGNKLTDEIFEINSNVVLKKFIMEI